MVLLRILGALGLAACLSACASAVSDVTVPVAPRRAAVSGTSALAKIPATTIDVRDLREPGGTGVLPGRIGERKTIGDISLGLVSVKPPPGQMVGDALRAEVKAAGHRVGRDGATATIDGDIRQFDIRTPATALYWDVMGTAIVSITATSGGRSASAQYTASCRERTYIWPSSEIIARVVGACVDDIARQFRDDPTIVAAMGG